MIINYKTLLFLFGCSISTTLIGQSNSTTLETTHVKTTTASGVEMYQSLGVERSNVPINVSTNRVDEPIENWDLEKCNNVLMDVERKLQHSVEMNDLVDVVKYQKAKEAIVARKAILIR